MSLSRIGESELILNRDGSIYHLALRPGDLAETIFLVGDPGRVEKVSKYFDRIERRVQKREFISHTGFLGDTRLSVISTGIGTDNIDIVINECDALFNIDFATREIKAEKRSLTFVRLGTSGAISQEVEVGSLLWSSFALGLDGLQHFYPAPESGDLLGLHRAIKEHPVNLLFPDHFYVSKADKSLLEKFGRNMQQGITLTSPGFYGPQGRSLRIPSRLRELPKVCQSFRYQGLALSNFEMETSAIFLLSHLLGHSAASVNAILAHRVKTSFSKVPGDVVDKMITQVLGAFAS